MAGVFRRTGPDATEKPRRPAQGLQKLTTLLSVLYIEPMEEQRQQIEAWIEADPDQSTQAELRQLLDADNRSELEDRFRAPLKFGTAGLRGLIGGGPNRMNRAVVRQTTLGLCRWLERWVPDAKRRGITIGFDGRVLSREFAEDAAAVALAAGYRVWLFDEVSPTPLLAFTVLHHNAAAGIQVTASHNPPKYNGYKVYWENGAQIIPPNDEGIAQQISEVGPAKDVPLADLAAARAEGLLSSLGEPERELYLKGVSALVPHPELPRDFSIAYTALHGVGNETMMAAFSRCGFDDVHSVAEQALPDGAFPTVAFPNPEEDGAMDMVLSLAKEKNATLVIANDPDADRLAVCARGKDGTYVQLSGNEIGCLLAHYLLSETQCENPLVLNTVVSSPMLGAIAKQHGAAFDQTLTGFKWIANEALSRTAESDQNFVLGYEEALGYCVGTLVRDKDGISAAVVMADMVAWCRSQGRTLLEERERMWRRYGLFLSRQVALVLPGTEGQEKIAKTLMSVRQDPPSELAGQKVVAVLDLQTGTKTTDTGVETITFPPANVIVLMLEGDDRVMLRPSGTEPKIKFYFDVSLDVPESEPLASARARGEAQLDGLVAAFRQRVGL